MTISGEARAYTYSTGDQPRMDQEEHPMYSELAPPPDLASQQGPLSLGSSPSFPYACGDDAYASRQGPAESESDVDADVDVLLGALFKEMRYDFEEYLRYLSDAATAGLDPRRMGSGHGMVVPSNKHDKSHLAFWSAVSCRDSLIVNCDKTFRLLRRGDQILRPPQNPLHTICTSLTSNLGISKETFSTLESRTPQIALRCIGGVDLILYLLARLQNRGFSSKLVLGCIMFLCVGADLVLSLCRRRQHSRHGGHGDGANSASARRSLGLEDPVRRIRDRAEQWALNEKDWRSFGAQVSAAAPPTLAHARAEASKPARLPTHAHVPDKAMWKEWRKPLAYLGLTNLGSGEEFPKDRRSSEEQVE